jgi:single-strand DNA-binding protein
MSSVGLNKWIVSGHLAADAQIKTVDLRDGDRAQVAEATLYVRKPRDRDESFTVRLSIWEKSYGWRKLPYLKKGSLIICTGSVEPNPYISSNGNEPKAGLRMTVLDIDLDNVKTEEEESKTEENKTEETKASEGNPFGAIELEPKQDMATQTPVPKAEKPKDKKEKAPALG